MTNSKSLNRREFLRTGAGFLAGAAAMSSGVPMLANAGIDHGYLGAPHFLPKAKRVIYLFQSGAPSTQDLFDYKPLLREQHKQELPDLVINGQRLTGMTANQSSFPICGSKWDFKQYGENGAWFSDLLPNIAGISDDLCIINSMATDAINHDPAITLMQTGFMLPGRPSFGAWVSYGLGSQNNNLPSFIVMTSRGTGRTNSQPLYSRLWGSGFLPSDYQGVQFRSGADSVLYLNNPNGIEGLTRRRMLDRIMKLNQKEYERSGDPEILSRISQYEMSYRMQDSIPDATNIQDEPEHTFKLYGEDARTPGTYAANCLMARRLVERDVRFIQLYHTGWDQHGNIPDALPKQAKDVDQATAGLITDLKQRGLLDDTLVVWGGEFGRTSYCQGELTEKNYGRDHHPRCFTMFMAGGGVKSGLIYGKTDDYGYNIVNADGQPIAADKHHYVPGVVHIYDLQATIMHLMGIDHTGLTYKYQGRRFRLTDVHGHVVKELLA
ncbi:DUF1501 domain-containing protein [Agaribacter flavus]|uniref:DUF1501 domain-containing protein n=1 Tax=Agaribacter flavus TaxID=1902781 RepID=A0ABV7FV94_9ALTE